MRPADDVAAGFVLHFLHRDVHAKFIQFGDDLRIAIIAPGQQRLGQGIAQGSRFAGSTPYPSRCKVPGGGYSQLISMPGRKSISDAARFGGGLGDATPMVS